MILEPLKLPHPDKLSVVMICKNEALHIDTIIPQIEQFADEIIVNDTGSTDGSIEMLSKWDSVRLLQGKWVDSFAVARNQARSHASYGWVMWLDFDDRIPQSEIAKINKFKTAPLDRYFNFRVICTEDGGKAIGVQLNQSRMFPNHPEIRWVNRVHETFTESADALGLYKIYTDAEIHHTGYEDKEIKRNKQIRNLALMELDEKVQGENPRFHVGKGDGYSGIGKHREAVEIYESVYTEELKAKNPGLYNAIPCRIGNCFLNLNEHLTAIEWYKKSNLNIEALYNMARCFEYLGNFESAIPLYHDVIDFVYHVSHEGSHYHRCKMYAFQCLAMILVAEKREHEAVRVITKMLQIYPLIKLSDPNHD